MGGTRAEKSTTGNLTTQFYYMGGLGYLDAEDTEFAADQEIAEYAGASLIRRYYRLPGSVDEAFLMIDASLPAGDRERWAHPNRLGSTIVVTDGAGAVIDTHTYAPFGTSGEGDGAFAFRFTGQKLDPETGLYYYKARYYDPELGRFLQTDPIGYADQMNLYAYVGNDPINAIDPSGMCTGSRIKNGDGNCSSTGGHTTGLTGIAQGMASRNTSDGSYQINISDTQSYSAGRSGGGNRRSTNGTQSRGQFVDTARISEIQQVNPGFRGRSSVGSNTNFTRDPNSQYYINILRNYDFAGRGNLNGTRTSTSTDASAGAAIQHVISSASPSRKTL